MTTKEITIILGHPDPQGNRFCHALGHAYLKGAEFKGHQVKLIDIAQIEFPILRSQKDFMEGSIPASLQEAQNLIHSAQHLVIIYPLWLGTMPAYLKAFLEQVFRPDSTHTENHQAKPWERQVSLKTAHIVITMGVPDIIYRSYFLSPGTESIEGNILAFSGIKVIQQTIIGGVDSIDNSERKQWLDKMELSGRSGL
jgi:putative NADPH-quinone reductase